MALLIYDSTTSTHLYEFCEFLFDLLLKKKPQKKVHFLLNEKVHVFLFNHFGSEFQQLLDQNNIIICVIPIKKQIQFDQCKNVLYLSYLEELYVNDYCIKNKIDEIIFFQIDLYQIIIGLRRFLLRKRIKISGILFSPYTFYPSKFKFLKLRKYLQISCMLLNPDIDQLFILNDSDSVNQLNKNHSTTVFKLLVDPIKKRNIPLRDFRCELQINKNDIVFLSLGGISHRKNIHTILEALDLLPENVLDRLKVIISGETHDSEYALGIKRLINNKLTDKVIFMNHFLEINELESLVCFSDAVLTVYVDFYSSSGVVGNASKYHKPLIAANTGVIGRMTNEFSLGLTVNPNSANEISDAITQLVFDSISVTSNAQFEAYNTRNHYLKFAEQFLAKAYV